MEFGLKWVHMAQYELILRLDGALWLTIISKTPMTPRKAMEGQKKIRVMGYFWGRRGPEMIGSHRAPSSLNMNSYQAIWTHFRPNFIFFEQEISDPGPKILVLGP